jgi:hypothetical protein
MTTTSERVERLARVLEEHPCWADPRWRMPEERRDAPWRTAQIDYLVRFGGGKTGTDGLAALRAAIAEVEPPFAVLGSPTRCCVCDGGNRVVSPRCPGGGFFVCNGNEGCHGAFYEARLIQSDSSRDAFIRRILRARRLYRDAQKAKGETAPKPRIFTGVEWGVDGSRCTVRVRRESDGRLTLLDEVYEPAKPATVSTAMRGEGKPSGSAMDWRCAHCGATGARPPSFGDVWECHGCGALLMRGTAVPKPILGSTWRDTCARTDCVWRHGNGRACPHCSGWRQNETWNVSCVPRGDDWLRAIWREDAEKTEVLRRVGRLTVKSDMHGKILDEHAERIRALEENTAGKSEARECFKALYTRVGKLERRFPDGCIVIPVEDVEYDGIGRPAKMTPKKPKPKRAGKRGGK